MTWGKYKEVHEDQKKEVILRVKLIEKNNISTIAIMRMEEHWDFEI